MAAQTVAPRAPPPVLTAVAAQLLGLTVLGSVVAFHEAGHFSVSASSIYDHIAIGKLGLSSLTRRTDIGSELQYLVGPDRPSWTDA